MDEKKCVHCKLAMANERLREELIYAEKVKNALSGENRMLIDEILRLRGQANEPEMAVEADRELKWEEKLIKGFEEATPEGRKKVIEILSNGFAEWNEEFGTVILTTKGRDK